MGSREWEREQMIKVIDARLEDRKSLEYTIDKLLVKSLASIN